MEVVLGREKKLSGVQSTMMQMIIAPFQVIIDP
jgi:hypothetical protein